MFIGAPGELLFPGFPFAHSFLFLSSVYLNSHFVPSFDSRCQAESEVLDGQESGHGKNHHNDKDEDERYVILNSVLVSCIVERNVLLSLKVD